jgi:hypothetical protein
MAGDWIKMRTDLFTHPKVIRISSALKADRLRTVGGLMSVWCLFDAHSVDGRLEGYDAATIDDLIGWAGFADAMKAAGWLAETPEGLSLPDFERHNGQSAKRRAQDADRKREGRSSASDADTKRTREEKRREEKEDKATVAALPDFVPADAWSAFVEMRKKIKKPMTARAVELMFAKLDRFAAAGHDVKATLEKSTLNCWQDVFEPKDGAGQVVQAQNRFAGVK